MTSVEKRRGRRAFVDHWRRSVPRLGQGRPAQRLRYRQRQFILSLLAAVAGTYSLLLFLDHQLLRRGLWQALPLMRKREFSLAPIFLLNLDLTFNLHPTTVQQAMQAQRLHRGCHRQERRRAGRHQLQLRRHRHAQECLLRRQGQVPDVQWLRWRLRAHQIWCLLRLKEATWRNCHFADAGIVTRRSDEYDIVLLYTYGPPVTGISVVNIYMNSE